MKQTTVGSDDLLGPGRSLPLSPLAVAAFASIGAGAIHAAAIGMHSEHRAAVVAFAVMAALQLGWGVVALTRANRLIAFLGVAINGVAIVAWVRAKTGGIQLIDGLDESEAVQLADGVAVALAVVATGLTLWWLLQLARAPARGSVPPVLINGSALAVVALTLTGMIATGSHNHAGGDEHAHGADGHASDTHAAGGDHSDAAIAPKPYDPTQPIDLGGVEGVTPEQQARAENLIAQTLIDLPQFADPAVAEANGFFSIGDAITGDEHYINWANVNDQYILDPDHPESLVYQEHDGQKVLVAAMFMLPDGTTLDQVPDVGGPLTQWHVHNDLCFTDDPVRARLAIGSSLFVDGDEPCEPPTVKKANVPMLHVWITPHPCGPFAALEGVGAGQISEGEERLCDHAHGSG